MNTISLTPADLLSAAAMLLLLAISSWLLNLNIARRLLISALRMAVQLLLVGMVLRWLFAASGFLPVFLMSAVMLLAAGREIWARQSRPIAGSQGYLLSTSAVAVSNFSVTFIALLVIGNSPWYQPQYAIPLLGMLLGNAMTGTSLAANHLTEQLYQRQIEVEQRLMLGETWQQASLEIRRECMRTGMIPVINSMSAMGLVSLPGMMTGQILGGVAPMEAVKYQILIMLFIAASTGLGVMTIISLSGRVLFDQRHRLRLDRLKAGKKKN